MAKNRNSKQKQKQSQQSRNSIVAQPTKTVQKEEVGNFPNGSTSKVSGPEVSSREQMSVNAKHLKQDEDSSDANSAAESQESQVEEESSQSEADSVDILPDHATPMPYIGDAASRLALRKHVDELGYDRPAKEGSKRTPEEKCKTKPKGKRPLPSLPLRKHCEKEALEHCKKEDLILPKISEIDTLLWSSRLAPEDAPRDVVKNGWEGEEEPYWFYPLSEHIRAYLVEKAVLEKSLMQTCKNLASSEIRICGTVEFPKPYGNGKDGIADIEALIRSASMDPTITPGDNQFLLNWRYARDEARRRFNIRRAENVKLALRTEFNRFQNRYRYRPKKSAQPHRYYVDYENQFSANEASISFFRNYVLKNWPHREWESYFYTVVPCTTSNFPVARYSLEVTTYKVGKNADKTWTELWPKLYEAARKAIRIDHLDPDILAIVSSLPPPDVTLGGCLFEYGLRKYVKNGKRLRKHLYFRAIDTRAGYCSPMKLLYGIAEKGDLKLSCKWSDGPDRMEVMAAIEFDAVKQGYGFEVDEDGHEIIVPQKSKSVFDKNYEEARPLIEKAIQTWKNAGQPERMDHAAFDETYEESRPVIENAIQDWKDDGQPGSNNGKLQAIQQPTFGKRYTENALLRIRKLCADKGYDGDVFEMHLVSVRPLIDKIVGDWGRTRFSTETMRATNRAVLKVWNESRVDRTAGIGGEKVSPLLQERVTGLTKEGLARLHALAQELLAKKGYSKNLIDEHWEKAHPFLWEILQDWVMGRSKDDKLQVVKDAIGHQVNVTFEGHQLMPTQEEDDGNVDVEQKVVVKAVLEETEKVGDEKPSEVLVENALDETEMSNDEKPSETLDKNILDDTEKVASEKLYDMTLHGDLRLNRFMRDDVDAIFEGDDTKLKSVQEEGVANAKPSEAKFRRFLRGVWMEAAERLSGKVTPQEENVILSGFMHERVDAAFKEPKPKSVQGDGDESELD